MNEPAAIAALVATLTAVPVYESPTNLVYEVLGREQLFPERPLTLRTVREYAQLIRGQHNQAQDHIFTVHQVIQSCRQIPPTPLPVLPLGF